MRAGAGSAPASRALSNCAGTRINGAALALVNLPAGGAHVGGAIRDTILFSGAATYLARAWG